MQDIQQQLLEHIRDRYRADAEPGTALSSLGIDSMQMADVAAELERRFDIEVDQDLFEVQTLAELAAYIAERRLG